eukprot:maker-scaffold886_size84816-snap-gene-0.27 protein:Tk01969 transcript:maker-scaffold886_size84816-snap-gene-0.27-mRNA-1 annotation:"upf0368 protein cxorf26 homolog"
MALDNQGVGAAGLLAAADTLAQPAEEFGNDSRVESLWAMKAMEHAEVYFNILCSVDPLSIPRLSPCDDDIYRQFREEFPTLKVDRMTEADLKSDQAKANWRQFCDEFKHVDDFSFATLLRLDASGDYTEANSIIVTKIQFYAIELARNKEGHNSPIRHNFKPIPRKRRPKTGPAGGGSIPNMSDVEAELQEILAGKHPMLKQ